MSDVTVDPTVNETAKDNRSWDPPASLDRVQTTALGIGVVGVVLSAFGFFQSESQFYQSYLVSWVFWLSLGLGCLGWLMLQHLTGGTWGLILRRTMEAAGRTLPVLFILFLPILVFGMETLYSWARPEAVDDALIQSKAGYLNVPFFWARAVLYFVVWSALAFLLSKNSKAQDETGDPATTVRMRMISGPGIVLYVLASSFACWDWLMSLDPHWFSSLYAFYFVSSTALASLLFLTVCAWYLHRRKPLQGVFVSRHFHDYGKLTLALTMFWAYMTLSQFLIIYSGNIPEYTTWYAVRNSGGWQFYTVPLIILHFFVPFLMLLSASLKKKPSKLVAVALYMLVMHWFDLYWQGAPIFHSELSFHWLDVSTLLAVGGLWMFFFVRELKKRSLLPVNEPYLPELIGHG